MNEEQNINEPQNPAFLQGAVSSRFTCDHCGENWEIEFKCKDCSDKIITIQSERPNLHWSGYPIEDEYIMGDENVSSGNVCGNCCSCHENGC
jgi:hypothetical protein